MRKNQRKKESNWGREMEERGREKDRGNIWQQSFKKMFYERENIKTERNKEEGEEREKK